MIWVFFFLKFGWFVGFGVQMDKASIIKDAIDYIQELHEQERRIQTEIGELESGRSKKNLGSEFDQELPVLLRSKKKKIEQLYDSGGSRTSTIEVLEVSQSFSVKSWSIKCIPIWEAFVWNGDNIVSLFRFNHSTSYYDKFFTLHIVIDCE